MSLTDGKPPKNTHDNGIWAGRFADLFGRQTLPKLRIARTRARSSCDQLITDGALPDFVEFDAHQQAMTRRANELPGRLG